MTTPSDRVRTYFDRVWSQGDVQWVTSFFAPIYLHNLIPRQAEALAGAAAAFRARFPDLRVTVDRLIERGDLVVARVTYIGSQALDWRGKAANGEAVELTALDVFRFEEGVVVEQLHESDHERLWIQLGVQLPPP